MKLLLFSTAIAILAACGSAKEVEIVKEEIVKEEMKPQRNIQLTATVGEFKESDPITINAVRVEGNKLFIDVSYSGGCKEHAFELIGSPVVIKTLPPKRTIQLYHNSYEDVCREFVSTTIEIDIQSLTVNSASGSENILLLKGWEEPITYIFE